MNDEQLLSILRAPHVSEKGVSVMGDYHQYTFVVAASATKPKIKAAVEKLLKVKVRSVRVCNVKSKPARFGQIQGRTSAWKKAYVMLAKGETLALAGVES